MPSSFRTRLRRLAHRHLEDYDRGEPGTAFAEGLELSLDEAYQSVDKALRVDKRDDSTF